VREERQFGLFSATLLIVASMIGNGVFTISGFLLADIHSRWLVLLAWAVGGIVALLGALSYGALARRIPESGGEYIFLARTLHLAGWASLLVGFSAPLAAATAGFGEYIRPAVGEVDPRLPGTILLVVFCSGPCVAFPARHPRPERQRAAQARVSRSLLGPGSLEDAACRGTRSGTD
jgi:amino acid transporter